MIKIGVIGCGEWSDTVINEIKKNKNFIFNAIVCRKENHKYLKDDIYVYNDIKGLINSNSCDSIYVAADPAANLEILNLIKLSPVPIILEKPFSNSYKNAIKMQEIVLNNNFLILINLPNIYSECFKKIKQIVNSNLENITEIKIFEGGFGPFRNNINPIWDWGYHSFSILVHLFGENTFSNIKLKELKKNKIYGNGIIGKFEFNINSKIKVKVINGNLFKNKIRTMKLFDNDKNIYEFDMINHKILKNNRIIFTNTQTPIQNLLNSFHKYIIKKNFKNKDINIKTLCDTEKILETFYKC